MGPRFHHQNSPGLSALYPTSVFTLEGSKKGAIGLIGVGVQRPSRVRIGAAGVG